MKKLPIRLKLASWYFAIFAAAQLAFGLGMWVTLRHNLYAIIEENLDERVESVRRFIAAQKAKNSSIPKMQEEVTESYTVEPEGEFLQISVQSGEWIYRSKALAHANVPEVPTSLSHSPSYSDLMIEQKPFRFVTQTVSANGRAYIVQSGVPTQEAARTLSRFLWELLLLAPPLLLLASAGGYWISSRALAPVDSITRNARTIEERNLSSRLEKLDTGDELQRLSDTLNEMLDRIETAFRRITRFTADASHELRTPISLIRIEAELALRRSRKEDEYKEALSNVLLQAEKTTTLLEDLLSLARGDAGRETLEIHSVDLRTMVQNAAQAWVSVAEEKGLTFSQQSETQPLLINGNQLALERVIAILLDNAFKYTPQGGTVEIAVGRQNGSALLRVRDTGIGIAPEHHRKIFERFYRVDQARSKETGGSGLGLAIAAWIVLQHKGTISVESVPTCGATFEVALPVEP